MGASGGSKIPEILKKFEAELLADWIEELMSVNARKGLMKETELREECREFLDLFNTAVQQGNLTNIQSTEWQGVREILTSISRKRSQQGFTPSETAMFVFSFKQPLFNRLRQELTQDPIALTEDAWLATTLLDRLGLLTTEAYQRAVKK